MRPFQERWRVSARRRALLWGAAGLALGLVFVLGRAAARMKQTEELARARFENESVEARVLAAREQELHQELAALGDSRGLEEALRRKFRVAKEDEQLVVILDGEPKTPLEPQQSERPSLFGWVRNLLRGVTSETYTRP